MTKSSVDRIRRSLREEEDGPPEPVFGTEMTSMRSSGTKAFGSGAVQLATISSIWLARPAAVWFPAVADGKGGIACSGGACNLASFDDPAADGAVVAFVPLDTSDRLVLFEKTESRFSVGAALE